MIRDAILRSARAVLRSRGAATDTAARLDRETLRRSSWHTLLAEGAVQRKLITRGEAAKRLGTQDSEPDKVFIDLWLALATPPPIGESLLGQRIYESELGRIGPDDDLLLIGGTGLYSFKGTEWRQSGTFSRIELVQGDKTFRLKAADHTPVEALRAAGAPELREIAVFRIAHASGFDSTKPFRLDLDLGAPTATSGANVVSLEYRVPERYLIAPPASPAAAPPGKAQAASNETLWQDIWWARRFEIGVLGVMLAVLAGILVFQDTVTAHGKFYYRLRTGYLLLTLIFLGFIANAQLSVVNVLTFIHALLSGFRWELFLLDPLVFLLWSFVAVSMLFWGRGVFCGWLCPFGTLQELTNQLAQRLGIKQIEIPFGLHERLWMIKYVVFVGILAVSLRSIIAAFQLAEIEPFKTAITMKFHARVAVRDLCRRSLAGRPVSRAVLLPLPLPARRGAGDPGAHAHVRMAQALSRMRIGMPCLRPALHRAGHPSARPDQSQRVHLLPEVPGELFRSRSLPASEEARAAATTDARCQAGWPNGSPAMTTSPDKPTRRHAITIFAAAAAGAFAGGPARSSADYEWHGVAMGADATILFNGIDRGTARRAIELVETEIDRLEDALSLFRQNSELCRLNRGGILQSPSADLRRALTLAVDTAAAQRRTVRPDRASAVGGSCRLVLGGARCRNAAGGVDRAGADGRRLAQGDDRGEIDRSGRGPTPDAQRARPGLCHRPYRGTARWPRPEARARRPRRTARDRSATGWQPLADRTCGKTRRSGYSMARSLPPKVQVACSAPAAPRIICSIPDPAAAPPAGRR